MRTYAQLTTSFVVFCNRVGVDESISFWGGSEVIAPGGEPLFSAPLFDEGLFFVDVALADVRRERLALPLLRDERPELQVRELAGSSPSAPAWRIDADELSRGGLARPGLDVAAEPIASGSDAGRAATGRAEPATCCRRQPRCSSCRDELAIDTDVARRVIAEFIRGQLRQAGFERAVLGLSGGIDSALVAYLVAEAIGAERLLCVLMPYRTSSPASRATPRRSCAGSAARPSSSTSARWSTGTSAPTACRGGRRRGLGRRRSGAGTSWRGCG